MIHLINLISQYKSWNTLPMFGTVSPDFHTSLGRKSGPRNRPHGIQWEAVAFLGSGLTEEADVRSKKGTHGGFLGGSPESFIFMRDFP
jgi:hypothetical protein